MYDLIIKNGTVVDGSGALQVQADVAVSGNVIAAIGDLHDQQGKREIDASGMYVTPGFVDIQNHSDAYWALFDRPNFESLVAQGITSIIVGACGASLAPLISPQALLAAQKWHKTASLNTNWTSFKEYLHELEKRGYGANVGSMVGYSTLRRGMIGDESRPLSANELQQVIHALRQSIQDGAFGLSCGLSYAHEANSGDEELSALANVVADEGGLLSIHMRSEGDEVMEGLSETLDLAAKASFPGGKPLNLKIAHFKIRGKDNWHLMPHAIEQIESSYQKYGNIHFDLYPYDFTWQALYTYLPRWSYEGGRPLLMANLKDPVKRKKILDYLGSKDINYAGLYIASTAVQLNVAGKLVGEIARRHETTSEEAMLAIIENGGSDILAFERNIDPDQVNQLLAHPLAIVGSDGAAFSAEAMHSEDLIHPRCFGTMPEFLHRVISDKLCSIEDGVRKMTGVPAAKVGLEKRGVLAIGNFADIAVFGKDVEARASMQDPYRFPKGMNYVLANGTLTVDGGQRTGALPGRVLRKK